MTAVALAAFIAGVWLVRFVATLGALVWATRPVDAPEDETPDTPDYAAIPLTPRPAPGDQPLPELTAQKLHELHDERRAITGESIGGIRNG